MPRGRPAGVKNRNYPPITLTDALAVARSIQEKASGTAVSRLTLAELLNVSPSSSNFRDLVAASRMYGLTNGGINSAEFSLAELGDKATGADEVAQATALKQAVMNIEPHKLFLEAFSNKKVPAAAVFREFLVKSAGVATERAEECATFIQADAEAAGLIRTLKGGSQYIDLAGAMVPIGDEATSESATDEQPSALDEEAPAPPELRSAPEVPGAMGQIALAPKKVFIAHGKNRTPLDQLKSALDTFKVSYAIAVEEPNKGRPISRKVANLMRDECSSGIFIFTADERFFRETDDGATIEVWRPSENVVYELGAASILYEKRIVIFKEKGVTFPTDFSDLGYIEFETDQLVAELGSLFKELVALDILEVRAKG